MSGENGDGQVQHDPLTHYGGVPGGPGYQVGDYIGHDPTGELARAHARAAVRYQAESAEVFRLFFRFVFRLLTLPVWIPIAVWLRQKRKRKMAEFAKARVKHGVTGHREIALEWMAAHPDKYPWGEYDPTLPKLQETFRKILARGNPPFS